MTPNNDRPPSRRTFSQFLPRAIWILTIVMAFYLSSGYSYVGSSGYGFDAEKIPLFNVPCAKTAPSIDGKINPEEWTDATKLMGTANFKSLGFVDRPHTFYVPWDKEHLYVAGRAHFLPNDPLLQQKRRKYSTEVVYDDAFEFGIDLLGINSTDKEASSYCKFVINKLKSGEYMKMYPCIGQYMYNWRPEMDIGTRFHSIPDDERFEAPGEHWFDIEVAMDLEDLEIPRTSTFTRKNESEVFSE